jgi:type I restriction enzyme S subunit
VLTTRGTVGNVAYYGEKIPFDNIRINSGMVIIRPNREELYPLYCYYIFIKLQSNLDTYISGTAQPQLPIKDMVQMPIILPPLPTQRAIACVLSSLDDKIDLLTRQNATLEALAQTYFRQWFVEEAGDEETTLGEFTDNIKVNVKTDELLQYERYVGLEHIPRKQIALLDWGTTDAVESNKSAFQENDILFGKLRSYFHKVVFAPIDGVCSTDILVIRSKKTEWFSFCLFWFSNKDVVEYSDLGSVGTRMPRTNWEIISNYKIPLPDYDKIKKFGELVKPMIKKIKDNIFQVRTLQKLRDTLLPKLISGEVHVKQQEEAIG